MHADIILCALLVLVLGGHVIQIVLGREDWPFSSYTMYAHRVTDHQRNPYSPCCGVFSSFATGCLVVVAKFDDGSAEVLTAGSNHPLIRPFERTRVVLGLTTHYRANRDLTRQLVGLLKWIRHRSATIAAGRTVAAIELRLFLWRAVPSYAHRNHPPDSDVLIQTVGAAS